LEYESPTVKGGVLKENIGYGRNGGEKGQKKKIRGRSLQMKNYRDGDEERGRKRRMKNREGKPWKKATKKNIHGRKSAEVI